MRIYGINQNINFNKKENKIIKKNDSIDNKNKINEIIGNKKVANLYYLYSYPLEDIKNNNEKDNKKGLKEEKASNSILLEKGDNIERENINKDNIADNKIIENNENNNIINDDDNNNIKRNEIYEDNIYYNQMLSLYEIIKKSKIYANLLFEPINDIFLNYLEGGPDILHIKVNSILDESNQNKKLYINLDLNGKLDRHLFERYTTLFQLESNVSKIKLLILSTQNIEEFEKQFKKIYIKNIIYVNNSKLYEEEENLFINSLYECLLRGKTVQESFDKSKTKINNKEGVKLVTNNKDNEKNNELKIYDIDKDDKEENRITLNQNCLLNLDYIKYNYEEYKNYYKIVMTLNKELRECINYLDMKKKVCVYGYEGVGTKYFIQKVGYYRYERNRVDDVYYIELYSLDNSSDILELKTQEIIHNIYKDLNVENKPKLNINNILIIVFFNFSIKDEKNLIKLDKIINESNNNFNFLFAFTISKEIKNIKDKKIINYSSIELGKLDKKEQEKLLNKCLIDHNKKTNKIKKKILDSNLNENSFSNIHLRALFINYFYNLNKGNKEFEENENITNEIILEKILEYEDGKIDIKKIFAFFSILKFGINSDIFYMKDYFFNEKEIEFIQKKLNYLIFVDKNENESVYYMDSSFIEIIINIFIKKYNDELLYYLELILQNYALIFRYLLNYSNFPYDISTQFHPGINNNFWNSPCIFYENFEKKNPKIYFDDVIYSNNIFSLFNYKELRFRKMIAEQLKNEQNECKDGDCPTSYYSKINDLKKYICQISIYLPTILHFKNSLIYRNLILDLFLNSNDLDKYIIKLKMIKFWISEKAKLNLKQKERELISEGDEKAEFYLITIYDYIIKRKNDDISSIFENCQKNIKEEDFFNLSRLNLLYGIYTNDKKFFQEAEKYGKKSKNLYLELKSKLMQIECLLNENTFDNFDKEINECIKIKNDNIAKDNSLKNSDIEEKISKLFELKHEKFNNYVKNILFFFHSTPFYDENNKPLKTESNNSFFLKYKLNTKFPKLQFDFQKIDKKLKNLKKCLNYPIRFLYIGSDLFNDQGNICYEDEAFKGNFIKNEDIEEIIKNSKCKDTCDIVILGFLNSQNLYKKFESNNFRHIIYIKEFDSLNKIFIQQPYLYFYFQKNFFNFIQEFILNLSKSRGFLTIKEAFRRANNNFNEVMKSKFFFEKDEKKTSDSSENIINILYLAGKEEYDDDICDFGLFNDDNFNSYSNKEVKIKERDIYDEIDEVMKNNNIYFRKNPFKNDFQEKEEKVEEKKRLKYYKLPGKDYLRYSNFKRFIEKGFFGMKDILRDIINNIKNFAYLNIFGNEFRGKTKLYEEACKYLYMNGDFKKGIFIILKNFRTIKSIPELQSRAHNKNKTTKDILIVIDNVDKLESGLFDLLKELDVHTVFISEKNLEEISLGNKDKIAKKSDKNLSEKNLNRIIQNNNIKSNKDKLAKSNNILNIIETLKKEKKLAYYNIDIEVKKYKANNKEFEMQYEKYKEIKFSYFN